MMEFENDYKCDFCGDQGWLECHVCHGIGKAHYLDDMGEDVTLFCVVCNGCGRLQCQSCAEEEIDRLTPITHHEMVLHILLYGPQDLRNMVQGHFVMEIANQDLELAPGYVARLPFKNGVAALYRSKFRVGDLVCFTQYGRREYLRTRRAMQYTSGEMSPLMLTHFKHMAIQEISSTGDLYVNGGLFTELVLAEWVERWQE